MVPFSYRIQHAQIDKMIKEEIAKQLAIQVLQHGFRSCCIGGLGFGVRDIWESIVARFRNQKVTIQKPKWAIQKPKLKRFRNQNVPIQKPEKAPD